MSDTGPGTERKAIIPVVGFFAYVMLGPMIWSLHLLVVYGAHSVLCALADTRAWEIDVWTVYRIVAAATAVAVALVAAALVAAGMLRRLMGMSEVPASERLFYDRTMTVLALLSLAAIIWQGAFVLMLPPCAALR